MNNLVVYKVCSLVICSESGKKHTMSSIRLEHFRIDGMPDKEIFRVVSPDTIYRGVEDRR